MQTKKKNKKKPLLVLGAMATLGSQFSTELTMLAYAYSVSRYQQSRCGSGWNNDGSATIGMILPPQDEHLQTSLL